MLKKTDSLATNPGADDVLARCEHINDSSVVGERGTSVGNCAGADGDSRENAGGGGVLSVSVGVPCRDGNVNTGFGELRMIRVSVQYSGHLNAEYLQR